MSVIRVLHAITTAYHAARQNRRERRDGLPADKEAHHEVGNNDRIHDNYNGNRY